MKLTGILTKDRHHWLAAIPALDALTQGTTRADAIRMSVAWVRDMLDRQDLAVEVLAHRGTEAFILQCAETAPVVALMLRRRREAAGLTLAQVAERMGSVSRNTFARYEQGKAVPSIEQLDRLLAAIEPTGGGVLVA